MLLIPLEKQLQTNPILSPNFTVNINRFRIIYGQKESSQTDQNQPTALLILAYFNPEEKLEIKTRPSMYTNRIVHIHHKVNEKNYWIKPYDDFFIFLQKI